MKINDQSTASKQVTTFTIEAPQLDTIKKIWLYLPKDYKYSRKAYPVIYMHDTQNLLDDTTSYVGEWHVDEYLDTLKANESIIVGIEHGGEKRINELTPYKNEKYEGGDGDRYLLFIKSTLKPYIDKNYRTLLHSKHTTLFGSSLGSLISFYRTIKFPETFSNTAIFSSAFWINPEVFELVKNSDIPKTSKFYSLVGTAEGESMVPNQSKMINLLLSKGVNEDNISNNIIPNGEHNEKFWLKYFGQAYQWFNKTN